PAEMAWNLHTISAGGEGAGREHADKGRDVDAYLSRFADCGQEFLLGPQVSKRARQRGVEGQNPAPENHFRKPVLLGFPGQRGNIVEVPNRVSRIIRLTLAHPKRTKPEALADMFGHRVLWVRMPLYPGAVRFDAFGPTTGVGCEHPLAAGPGFTR